MQFRVESGRQKRTGWKGASPKLEKSLYLIKCTSTFKQKTLVRTGWGWLFLVVFGTVWGRKKNNSRPRYTTNLLLCNMPWRLYMLLIIIWGGRKESAERYSLELMAVENLWAFYFFGSFVMWVVFFLFVLEYKKNTFLRHFITKSKDYAYMALF